MVRFKEGPGALGIADKGRRSRYVVPGGHLNRGPYCAVDIGRPVFRGITGPKFLHLGNAKAKGDVYRHQTRFLALSVLPDGEWRRKPPLLQLFDGFGPE